MNTQYLIKSCFLPRYGFRTPLLINHQIHFSESTLEQIHCFQESKLYLNPESTAFQGQNKHVQIRIRVQDKGTNFEFLNLFHKAGAKRTHLFIFKKCPT